MTEIKIFNKWDTVGIKVEDMGLERYVTLKPMIIPKSFGRQAKKQFHKSNVHILERLAGHLFVSGHRGKKHLLTSGKNVGKTFKVWKIIEEAFDIIEKRTSKNPIEVFIKAIENAALREEITSFQVGGIIVRKAVVTSPQRRVDLALRIMCQGAYQKSYGKGQKMANALAEEIMAAHNYDPQKSYVIREKERIERESMGSR